ncbi:MAG: hypothetical protein ACMXYG_04010 [Candidatus Woesearchaeota archaeon]
MKNQDKIIWGLVAAVIILPFFGFFPFVASPWNWFIAILLQIGFIVFLAILLRKKGKKSKGKKKSL